MTPFTLENIISKDVLMIILGIIVSLIWGYLITIATIGNGDFDSIEYKIGNIILPFALILLCLFFIFLFIFKS